MTIRNQDYFPDVEFLPSDKIKAVGTVGGAKLVVLGFHPGSDDAVVAKSYTDSPATEDLWASDLWELLTHSQEKVSIPGVIKASDFK